MLSIGKERGIGKRKEGGDWEKGKEGEGWERERRAEKGERWKQGKGKVEEGSGVGKLNGKKVKSGHWIGRGGEGRETGTGKGRGVEQSKNRLSGLDLYGEVEELLIDRRAGRRLWKLYLRELGKLPGRRLLDIGCGGGEFCRLAKRRGYQVTGIDLSPVQVERANRKGCHCIVERLENLEVEEPFDFAVAIFDVLNYIPPSHLPQFLQRVGEVANAFLFDINSYYGMAEVAVGALKREGDREFLCVESIYRERFHRGELITTFTLFREEGEGLYRRYQGEITQYYHPLQEITNYLPYRNVEIEAVNLYTDQEPEKWLVICTN